MFCRSTVSAASRFAGAVDGRRQFVPHRHPGGEEIYVLEGALEDEDGRYTADSRLRNPPAASIRPSAWTAVSCTSRSATCLRSLRDQGGTA